MKKITLIALLAVASLGLPVPLTRADIASDLDAVESAANALLVGGTLEGAALKAVEKVVKAVEKAKAVDDQVEPAKAWKKAAAVLRKTDAAAKKGVDLGSAPSDLLASLRGESADRRAAAVIARDALFVDKDKTKVGRRIAKGDAKEAKALLKERDGQKGKLYASAAKLFLKAATDGVRFLQKEIDKGLVVFELVSSSLDGNPTLVPGEAIELAFNLPVEAGSIAPDAITIVDDGSGAPVSAQYAPPFNPDEQRMLVIPEPFELTPGQTYTITLNGEDSTSGTPLLSREGIPLKTTVTIQFTVPVI